MTHSDHVRNHVAQGVVMADHYELAHTLLRDVGCAEGILKKQKTARDDIALFTPKFNSICHIQL